MKLGRYGVFGHATVLTTERARFLESLGYGTVWQGGPPTWRTSRRCWTRPAPSRLRPASSTSGRLMPPTSPGRTTASRPPIPGASYTPASVSSPNCYRLPNGQAWPPSATTACRRNLRSGTRHDHQPRCGAPRIPHPASRTPRRARRTPPPSAARPTPPDPARPRPNPPDPSPSTTPPGKPPRPRRHRARQPRAPGFRPHRP
jgi:hypothetical protein